jgi:HSP20 family protein
MALARYEPWNLVAQWNNDINRALRDFVANESSGATADWVPAADIEEYEDRFELFVDLPGVLAKEVDITLEGGVLSLSGERNVEQRAAQVTHQRRERSYGRFHRRFLLPDTVNADDVKATERGGVLSITIPKKAAAKPRRIEIAA